MTDELSYGGLDDASYQPPKEVVKDFSSSRWRALGSGNYPKWSVRPSVGSAYMVNHTPGVSTDDDPQKRTNLWVNEIIMGWSMDYHQVQTLFGKSFYPRHIRYSNAEIKCQSADQHHYDSMVSKILEYQKASLSGEASVIRFVLPKFALYRADKKSARWVNESEAEGFQDSRTVYNSLVFDGYLLGVSAGHRKGVFNPELKLTFAVIAYQDEVKSMIVTDTNQSGTNVNKMFEAYRDSLDTQKWNVEATSPIAESGYGSFFGGPAGGPGGNQG